MRSGISQEYYQEWVRGDTISFGVEFADLTATINEVYLSCRQYYGAPSYVFQVKMSDGYITTDGNGKFFFRVPPEMTADLAPGLYVYDVQFDYDGQDVVTPMIGPLKLTYGVTEGE